LRSGSRIVDARRWCLGITRSQNLGARSVSPAAIKPDVEAIIRSAPQGFRFFGTKQRGSNVHWLCTQGIMVGLVMNSDDAVSLLGRLESDAQVQKVVGPALGDPDPINDPCVDYAIAANAYLRISKGYFLMVLETYELAGRAFAEGRELSRLNAAGVAAYGCTRLCTETQGTDQ
jgi:hypothetical protein